MAAGSQRFRSPTNWLVVNIYSALVIVGVAAAVMVHDLPHRAFAVLFAVTPTALLAIRAARSGVIADDEGVLARGDRFTRRLRWDQIERFGVRQRWNGGVWARTLEGRWVKLLDVGLGSRAAGLAIAAELEVELRRHTK